MANNDDFGKGGSPWGSPGGGGNGSGRKGPTPPNIDEIVNKIQDLVKKFIPGNGSGKKPMDIHCTPYFSIGVKLFPSLSGF